MCYGRPLHACANEGCELSRDGRCTLGGSMCEYGAHVSAVEFTCAKFGTWRHRQFTDFVESTLKVKGGRVCVRSGNHCRPEVFCVPRGKRLDDAIDVCDGWHAVEPGKRQRWHEGRPYLPDAVREAIAILDGDQTRIEV